MATLAGIAVLGLVIGLVFVLRRYRAEQREVERLRVMFSRYVAPAVVEELLRRKDARLYTGKSMHATILVCRIWNFAGFSEAMTPEETLRYLNEFFALAGTSIQKHRGMIDKFLSDGIIGVFGVPIEDPFQEEHALRAALDIVRLVAAMDQRWAAQGRRSFQVGIGISSGKVIAGDAGYDDRREFTVVGSETLFAAQLQQTTPDLNAYIVASNSTCDVVRDMFTLVPISGVPLPGIKRLADAFIVRGLKKYDRDDLKLPRNDAFADTTITPPEPPPAPVQLQPAGPPAVAAPVRNSPQPDADPPPAEPMRRRTQPPDRTTAFDLPELRIPRFRGADEGPIMPDPPPPRATYEDGDGPPMQLPP